MAISKAMRAALKALSYPEPDIRKTYKLERELTNLTSIRLTHPNLYKVWDQSGFSPRRKRWKTGLFWYSFTAGAG